MDFWPTYAVASGPRALKSTLIFFLFCFPIFCQSHTRWTRNKEFTWCSCSDSHARFTCTHYNTHALAHYTLTVYLQLLYFLFFFVFFFIFYFFHFSIPSRKGACQQRTYQTSAGVLSDSHCDPSRSSWLSKSDKTQTSKSVSILQSCCEHLTLGTFAVWTPLLHFSTAVASPVWSCRVLENAALPGLRVATAPEDGAGTMPRSPGKYWKCTGAVLRPLMGGSTLLECLNNNKKMENNWDDRSEKSDAARKAQPCKEKKIACVKWVKWPIDREMLRYTFLLVKSSLFSPDNFTKKKENLTKNTGSSAGQHSLIKLI